jgi:hypothetical protein
MRMEISKTIIDHASTSITDAKKQIEDREQSEHLVCLYFFALVVPVERGKMSR